MTAFDSKTAARSYSSLRNAEPLETCALRRDTDPGNTCGINTNSSEALEVLNVVVAERKSMALYIAPERLSSLATLHAYACLQRLPRCCDEGLTSLLFPATRNSFSPLKDVLVDRESLCVSIQGPLAKISVRERQPWSRFVLALQSLHSVFQHNKRSADLKAAIVADEALQHPTLYELFPHALIPSDGSKTYDKKFLERLRRYTWINRSKQSLDAVDIATTPFLLIGIGPDNGTEKQLRDSDLFPRRGKRHPDVLLLDLTDKRKRSLQLGWKEQVNTLLNDLINVYVEDAPPVLAVSDDVYVIQELRYQLLNDYDSLRAEAYSTRRTPSDFKVIFNFQRDDLTPTIPLPSFVPKVDAQVFGTDGLRAIEEGLRLRRQLILGGEGELVDAVANTCNVLRRLLALPGEPRSLSQFLHSLYEGARLERIGAKYDHIAARARLLHAIDHGGGGAFQDQIKQFAKTFDAIIAALEKSHPARGRFDNCLRRAISKSERLHIAMPNALSRDFALWRIKNDPFLFDVRMSPERITLFSTKDALPRNKPDGHSRLIFFEPYLGILLRVLGESEPVPVISIISNHASAEQLCRELKIALELAKPHPFAQVLLPIESALMNGASTHLSDIGDLRNEVRPVRRVMSDFTDRYENSGAGQTRAITLSSGTIIRVFDGSEIPVFEGDISHPWHKLPARNIRAGDEICLFLPELVENAKEILKLSAHATDFLAEYHKTVSKEAANLSGSDLNDKAVALRDRILDLDPDADLPSLATLRRWIEVEKLLDLPRDQVRPHAPGKKEHYDLLMRALNVSDFLANLLWEEGVFGTRSARIKNGNFIHQLLMTTLIDPESVASRLPQISAVDLWKVAQTAEEYVETVISNEAIG
jgi:hypothetical protein